MTEISVLFPVNIGGKACYIDDNGSIMLQTGFLRGGFFSEDRAPVWDGQRYGFIDTSGTLVIAPLYDDVGRFSEGFCAASIGRNWGLIDVTGRWIIEPQFAEVGRCSYGRIGVSRRSGYDLSYIDLEGNVVIESVGLKGMSAFSEGLIAAGDDSTGLYGFRDTNGAWAIAPKFTATGEFSEGLAAVNLWKGKTELTGYIDTSGDEVLPFKYITTLSPFQCGLAVMCEKRKRDCFYGAINRSGDWVISPNLYYLGDFSEGLGKFSAKDGGKIGFLDTEGNVVIKELYSAVLIPFRHGIAYVRDEQGDLYINKAGECIWRK